MSNPALTLHGHLKHLMTMDQGQKTWPDAWEMVVGLRWAVAVRPLLGLIDETYDILATRPEIDLAPAMEYEPAWRSYILLTNVNTSMRMDQSGFAINPSAVNSLYLTSVLIDRFPEVAKPIPDAQIERLAQAVASLRQAVLEATDVEADLRAFLLDRLNDMQARLDHRRVTGDTPIENLIVETIGSSAVHSIMWQRAMATSLKTKIVGIFIAFNAIAGNINTTADAIDHVESACSISRQVISHVLGSGPLALEAPKQHALPAGSDEPSPHSSV